MPWDNLAESEESDADYVLCEMGFGNERVVVYERITDRLGLGRSRRCPRACRAFSDVDSDEVPKWIRVNERGRWITVQLYGHHELAHFAKHWCGGERPHDELSTTRVALRMLFPRDAMMSIYHQCRGSKSALLDAYADTATPRATILKRFAWADDRQLVFSFEHYSARLVCDQDLSPDMEERLKLLARWVRENGRAANDGDIEAEPYADDERRGVAIFLPRGIEAWA